MMFGAGAEDVAGMGDGALCAGALGPNRLASSSIPPAAGGADDGGGASSKSMRETEPLGPAPFESSGGMGFAAAVKSPFLYAS